MRYCLLIFILCYSITTRAQQFGVTITPAAQGNEPVLVKFGDGFFAVNLDMKGASGFSANLKRLIHSIELKKYDADLKLVQSVTLSDGERVYGPMRPELKIINEKLYLLYYQMPDEGAIKLFAARVDPSSLALSPSKQLLDIKDRVRDLEFHMRSVNPYTFNRIISRNTEGANEHKTFFLEPSPDGSKFLVVWNSGWNDHLFFSVLDKDLNKTRSGEAIIPDESSLALSNAFIDNTGNAGITYFYVSKGTGHAAILHNSVSGKSTTREIIIPDGEPNCVFAGINAQENKICISGTYKENSERLTGAYIQLFNPDGLKPGVVTKTIFPKELVDIFDKEGWGSTRAKNYGLSGDILFESFMLQNGIMNLTGEFRRVTEGTHAAFVSSGSLINIRFTDKTAVFARIPKIRVSAGTTFGDSYKLVEFKNKLIIFYNDHASNLNIDESKSPKRSDNYSNSVLVAAIINEDGSVKREIIIDQSKEDFLAGAEYIQELSPDNYIIRLYRVKNFARVSNNIKWAFLKIE